MVKDFFTDEKKIYDSIHGFIRLDEYEKDLIDSYPFQRLHYIRQLGISYLVYPGATHTRFEHSLGVMELATRIYHNICKFIRPDVFHLVPRKGSVEYHYWRRVLRFASLCHDLGHLPFSHVAEKTLLKNKGHEYWSLQIIQSKFLEQVWNQLEHHSGIKEIFPDRNIIEDISKIAIGEAKWKAFKNESFTPWERVISEIITGDFFGADRIDYLIRDSKSTGVAYGLFDYDQLIEMIRILPSIDEDGLLALGINENALESCEALLMARHFMHRRVYQYSTVKAYNFHLSRFMNHFFTPSDFESVESFLKKNDSHVITAIAEAATDANHPGHNDAKRILQRKSRFKAISLSFDIPEKALKEIQEKQNIPSEFIDWEFKKSDPNKKAFSFPVSKRHVLIEKAEHCSDLLSSINARPTNWIYISPDYEIPLTNALEEYRVLS